MSRERKKPETSPAQHATETSPKASGARKIYTTPKVRAYGNIREITLGSGHVGNKDNVPGSHKTAT